MENYKIRCIKTNSIGFTTGKIYEVINGFVKHESGIFSNQQYNSVEQINNNFVSQFELYKEEKNKVLLNCRVICVDDNGQCHIKGDIYKVVNGSLEYKDGEFASEIYDSIEQINNMFVSQFELYKEEKKEMLNCKVRCINDFGGSHTKDKIYEIKDGKLNSDTGNSFPMSFFKDINDINYYMSSKFELYEKETLKEKYFNQTEEFYLFELRNGDLCVKNKNLLLLEKTENLQIIYYDSDLIDKDNDSCFDVVKIYKEDQIYQISDLFNPDCYILDWERKPQIIELTIDEIAEKYKLKPEQIKIKK